MADKSLKVTDKDYLPSERPLEFEELLNKQLGLSGDDDHARELFDVKNIGAKTELSNDEVVYATMLKYLSDRYKIRSIDLMLHHFMIYRLSKKRSSRKEFMKVASEKIQNMANMFGGGMR